MWLGAPEIDSLGPARLSQHHFATLEDDSAGAEASTPPHIEVIDGVALIGVPRPPGTVVIALSDGQRLWSFPVSRIACSFFTA